MGFLLWCGIPEVCCSLSYGLGSGLDFWSFILAVTSMLVRVVLLNQAPHFPWTPTHRALWVSGPTYVLTLFLALQGKGLPGPPVSIYHPLAPPKCVHSQSSSH